MLGCAKAVLHKRGIKWNGKGLSLQETNPTTPNVTETQMNQEVG